MTARLNMLLIGAGVMGTHHARVIAQSSSATLATVVDPRQEIGEAIAARFNSTWSPELPDDLSGFDAIVVAAATDAHYELAVAALDAGVPVLVEKPLAASLEQTNALLERSERSGVPLMCGLLERYNPAVLTAQTLLSSPIHITATRHSPYAPRIKTGVAWDLLVHDVDLAIRLMDATPSAVDARLGYFHPDSAPGAEDVVEATMQFENGGIAQVSASRVGQRKIRQLGIYEHERLIEVDLLRRDVTVYHHVSENSQDGDGRGYRQQTVIEIPELVTSQEPLTTQFAKFVELVSGGGDPVKERDGIRQSHHVIEQVTSGRRRG